jgi:hypothetical protein
MGEINKSRPREVGVLQMYARLHYKARIKSGFDELWKGEQDRLGAAQRIHTCNTYIADRWKEETPEFRATVEESTRLENQRVFGEYRTRSQSEGTVESYEA